MRRFLVENAKAMAAEYRIDGIRYDEVTVIDDHGGWGFCRELTADLDAAAPDLINVAEFWRGDKSWILRPRASGGAGFDAAWLDSVRDAVRGAIAAAARGRSAWVDMTRVAGALGPTFGDSEQMCWRAVHCIDNHDLSLAAKPDKVPRIARLADPTNSRSWYGRSRSRVANALLLSAPGIPMLFMGQEILEDKDWSDNPGYFTGTLIWWQGVKLQREMSEHLRFMQDFIRLRQERAGLVGHYSRAYQVHDLDRILVLHRGNGNPDDDVVVVFSLNESTFRDYEIGLPQSGIWHLLLSGDDYEIDGQHTVVASDRVEVSGPGRATMPASARVTIPANGILVYGRQPGGNGNGHEQPRLHLRFQRPAGWAGSVNLHYWDTQPVRRSTQWPGEPMRHLTGDWYELELEGLSATSIVFNDGHGRQTPDLRRERNGWYLGEAGIWMDEYVVPPPVIEAFPREPVYSAPVTVHLTSSMPDDAIYYTTARDTPIEAFQPYPGSIELPLPATKQETTVYAYGINRDGGRGDIYVFSFVIDPDLDLRAPTVTAAPDGGQFDQPLEVVFTVSDDRIAPVTAYYTTDGTPATTSSPVYVAGVAVNGRTGPPVRIGKTTTVSLLVVDGAKNQTRVSFHYAVGQARDFREETIYSLLTARFYDGDSSRNLFCRDRIRFDERKNPVDPHWRGNFAGLIQRLDYIKELGFTAIWITPPVENRSGLDYHGHHAYDWTRIDPRLESPGATYADLIREVHARGMKIVQDVVINHSSNYGIRGHVWIDHLPIKYFVPPGSTQGAIQNGPYQGNLGNYTLPFREDNDNPVAPEWFRDRQATDPKGEEPLVDPVTGTTVPCPGYRPDRFFNVDTGRLDETWYHRYGFITGGGWETPDPVQQGHLANDCMDLNTENETVKRYLIDAVNRYLDLGVDALRIDTLKHMSRQNVLEYVNAWKARRPGLFVFGENLVKGTGFGDLGGDNAPSAIRPWWYTRLGDDPKNPDSGGDSGLSVLDFSLFSTFRNNLSQGNFCGLREVLERDGIYGDATKLVTFLQNHDVGPDNDWRFREHEPATFDHLAGGHRYRMTEHGPVVGEGVKLAPFATGVDGRRQLVDEGEVEGATDEPRQELPRIHAGDAGR
ncbi:MAG: starch-binding protein [Polyangiaceae bacterium]|nr:starch-binding protein [Polyangiaceae bacterium]